MDAENAMIQLDENELLNHIDELTDENKDLEKIISDLSKKLTKERKKRTIDRINQSDRKSVV